MADAMKLVPVAELKRIAQSLDDLCGQKTDDLADRIRALAASPPAREEAPAEGAGEPMSEREVRQWIDACNHEPGRQVLRDYLALRNRTSEPEAGALAWLGDRQYEPTAAMIDAGLENCRPGNHANMIASFRAMMQQAELDGLVAAPATADKLRVAKEALETAREDMMGWFEEIDAGVRVEHEMHVTLKDDLANIDAALSALNEQPQ